MELLQVGHAAFRFTPVHTGKSFPCHRLAQPCAVHPRAYGEESLVHPKSVCEIGSPPCIRGRGHNCVAGSLRWRFTPVHTGKRCETSASSETICGSPPCIRGRATAPFSDRHARPVHPRAYGEEAANAEVNESFIGSPPCIRGRGNSTVAYEEIRRFTPVHTGKSRGLISPTCFLAVHPRAYGEELHCNVNLPPTAGSPPCIRGRADDVVVFSFHRRFTPVHTGKSHHRECGTTFEHGSPPCIRGRDTASSLLIFWSPVHPRAYGEETEILRL